MSNEEQREEDQAWLDEWIKEQVTKAEDDDDDDEDWQLYECSVTAD